LIDGVRKAFARMALFCDTVRLTGVTVYFDDEPPPELLDPDVLHPERPTATITGTATTVASDLKPFLNNGLLRIVSSPYCLFLIGMRNDDVRAWRQERG
jgi:hypothetical protein